MKINQILNERVSLSHILPHLESFIVKMFQAETTQEVNNYSKVKPGTLAPDLQTLSLVGLEKMFDKYGFSDEIIRICKEVLNVNSKVIVVYGRKNLYGQTALMTDRSSDKLIYTFFLDYQFMEPLVAYYRSAVLDNLYQFDDMWLEEADNGLSQERAMQIVKLKDDAIADLLPRTDGFRQFCSTVVHELAHLMSEEAAYANYERNKDKYDIEKKIGPHVLSQARKEHKHSYNPVTHAGLDSHFANPAELDSYAQEIATKIRYAAANGHELPVRYIRQQLAKLVRKYRTEVALNLHNLTPKQRKYVYKLYKRVYQEIADILEGAKK